MNQVEIRVHNRIFKSDEKQAPSIYKLDNKDVEVYMSLWDEAGNKYRAQFIVKFLYVLMNADYKDYFDFLVMKKVNPKFINESTLFDMFRVGAYDYSGGSDYHTEDNACLLS